MEDSLFTKIIKGEIPCYKIYEDDNVIAFLDIHPVQPGHTLVVPKKQVDHFEDLDDEIYQQLWSAVKKLALHLKKLDRDRIGVIVDGTGVPHTHVHLIPFDTTEQLKAEVDMRAEPDHEALSKMAERLAIKESKI